VLRVLHVGRHRIFYRIDDAMVYVIRILHERMDTLLVLI
jgi:plasmid stabilization system protein ParE